MSSREGILTQSRRLVNNRRWGAGYRAGRPTSPSPRPAAASARQPADASCDRAAGGIVVIELAGRARPACP